MKAKYIILSALAAASALIFGCTPESLTGSDLSSLKVDKSYVQIDTLGGSSTIKVTATEDWELFVKTSYEYSVTDTAGKKKTYTVDTLITPGTTCSPRGITAEVTSWITATPVTGASGETVVTISAEASDSYRTQDVRIVGKSGTQVITVAQGEDVTKTYKASEAIALIQAGKQSGSPVIVKGIVCKIDEISVSYGNATYYISDDGTFSGTYNEDGSGDGNWLEVYRGYWLNGEKFTKGDEIAIGDEVTIKAVLISYKGIPETNQNTAEVVSIKKSLISATPSEFSVAKGDTTVVTKVLYSGDGLEFSSDVDWLNVAGMTKQGDTTLVSIHVAANVDDTRSGAITMSSSKGKSTSVVGVSVTQASGLLAYSLPYSETFLGSMGAWVATDIVPVDGVASIWVNDAKYGMKATSTKKIAAEAELVSPLIDLSSAASPVLSFEHVQRFAGNVYGELTLFASADNGATWTELQIPNYSDGSNWNYVPSGSISLKRFVGTLALIKFVYKSTADAYATWEIKNLKVEDQTLAITNVAELNNSAVDTEAEWSATLTDAVVSYVNGRNAFIQDATGGVQVYQNGHGLVAGQKINGTISGKIKMYHGFAEITAITVPVESVADGEAPAATVVTLDNLLAGYLHYQNTLIKLEGIQITGIDGRNSTVKQGSSSIAGYAQNSSLVLTADTTGDLVCIPTRYNATLQVGIWEEAHFTAN